ncbi:hypothetical protein FK545_09475 [Planococcus glaciei]|nr:hypothetical protein [Planococcus glaciei]QDY45577.1 hypothetical protein FK545_09475 [Planococcus glaciei]
MNEHTTGHLGSSVSAGRVPRARAELTRNLRPEWISALRRYAAPLESPAFTPDPENEGYEEVSLFLLELSVSASIG